MLKKGYRILGSIENKYFKDVIDDLKKSSKRFAKEFSKYLQEEG